MAPVLARLLLAGLVAALIVLFGRPAAAQAPPCAPRALMLSILANSWGERTVAVGVTVRDQLIEVTAAADGGTWTILVSQPDGLSCVAAAGSNWRSLAPAAAGRRS